jgi:hypothetical protein
MKQANKSSRVAPNWTWPEKTWFRERLNTVKAREQGVHPRSEESSKKPTAEQAEPGDKQENQED